MAKEKEFYCSFCGKSQNEVKKIIAGPNVFICDECVELCAEVVNEEIKTAIGETGVVPSPKEIKSTLDE
jgi:ATP-dependent Clp protease ATP-binding subunit ClpX